jgi:hypothetical protein
MATRWGWTRRRVASFLARSGVEIAYSGPVNAPQKSGQVVMQVADNLRTSSGQVIIIDSKGLRGEADNLRTSSGRVADKLRLTIKNPNPNPNPKRNKNIVKNQKIFNGDVEDIFIFWKENMNHPRAQLDKRRIKTIEAALNSGYAVDDIKAAVIGCSISPHHQGQNDRKTKYDDIELICRDAKHIDAFIKIATEKNVRAALTRKGLGNKSVLEDWIKGSKGRD